MKDRFWAFIDGLSPLMAILFVWLMLAPWPMGPEPHLVEKFGMFQAGTLTKPIDIFDVLWHSWPLLVMALWGYRKVSIKRAKK